MTISTQPDHLISRLEWIKKGIKTYGYPLGKHATHCTTVDPYLKVYMDHSTFI